LEETVRRFLCETLRKDGYEVVEATDGQVAMKVLRQQRVHLVFSDLATSEQNGGATIRRIRKFFPDIKIVALSEGIPAEILKMSSLLGADAVLPKPIAVDLLLKTTRQLLAD
jgi:CheY-like chemotaxis protein